MGAACIRCRRQRVCSGVFRRWSRVGGAGRSSSGSGGLFRRYQPRTITCLSPVEAIHAAAVMRVGFWSLSFDAGAGGGRGHGRVFVQLHGGGDGRRRRYVVRLQLGGDGGRCAVRPQGCHRSWGWVSFQLHGRTGGWRFVEGHVSVGEAPIRW